MYVLLVALASVSAARADEPKNKYPKFQANWPTMPPAWNPGMRQAGIAAADNKALTCKVYGLSALGDDPNLGKWIAETLPAAMNPHGGGRLSYYRPGQPLMA